MKTQLSSVCRRLAAAVLLLAVFGGTSLSMAAVTLADAHADLAAGNFAALKTDTEAIIAGAPSNSQEAHVLHAIALLGLASKNDVPVYLVSLGAKAGATIDPLGNGTAVDFPTAFTYDTGSTWKQSGATYSLARAFEYGEDNKPLICFENRGTADYTLTLQLGTNVGSLFDYEGSLILNGSDWGFIDAYSANGNQYFWGELPGNLEGSLNPETKTATFTLHPGDNLTIEDGRNSAGVRFTIVGTRPSTLVVLNGKGAYDSHPKFAAKANLTGFFAFATKEDSGVLAPVVNDLAAVTATDFQMTLPSSETGHPVDIVIQYPDVQVMLAFLKFNQGARLLSKSFNWSFDLSGGTFFEADGPVALLKKNAAFLSAAKGSSAAERTSARQLLDAAAQCYVNADAAGLWTRTPPIGGSYLFGVDTQADDAAQQRATTLDNVSLFRTMLTGTVPVADVFPGFAAAESLPDTATFSLAPLFAATPLNIRGILPTFTNGGIQAGTSMKLLSSGLFKGVGSGPWEHYLWMEGMTDDTVAAARVAPVIYSQPTGGTVVAGSAKTFTVQADGYPVPTYQWKKNGAVIPGATGASYTIASVAKEDAGSYTVTVANSVKAVNSSAAKLVVHYAPSIVTQPVSQSVKAGKAAKFSVVATGNPAVTYQWRRNGTPILKATKATYSVKATTLTLGTYDVVVTNSVASVTSSPAELSLQSIKFIDTGGNANIGIAW
ncbi:MAG: immunoglobulin domain-containing protein [Opitutaceae bacterium]|jgi:hypothetical protein